MPIKKELLEILCCPVTKEPVEILGADKKDLVNKAIKAGGVKHVDGSPVEQPLTEALLTTDRKVIYRIDEGIPVMLADMGITTDQCENF